MIPRSNITEWRSVVPWTANEQVEQDLVISRAIVEIFSDPYLKDDLAFRGGTAIYKLFFSDPVRYSEDIDLVRIKTGPIKETLNRLHKQLEFLGQAGIRQKERNTILHYRFDTEIPPVINNKLKIEINCREHHSKFELVNKEFEVKSGWYSGNCSVVTYRINELIGTKLRALYQRKKGRDLFDIWHILENNQTKSQEILEAYYHYLDLSRTKISKKQFINNIEKKITDPEFIKDIAGLLRPDISFDFEKVWETIKVNLIDRMDR